MMRRCSAETGLLDLNALSHPKNRSKGLTKFLELPGIKEAYNPILGTWMPVLIVEVEVEDESRTLAYSVEFYDGTEVVVTVKEGSINTIEGDDD